MHEVGFRAQLLHVLFSGHSKLSWRIIGSGRTVFAEAPSPLLPDQKILTTAQDWHLEIQVDIGAFRRREKHI